MNFFETLWKGTDLLNKFYYLTVLRLLTLEEWVEKLTVAGFELVKIKFNYL